MTKTAKNQSGEGPRSTPEKSPWSKRVLVVAGVVAFVLMVVVVINGTLSEPRAVFQKLQSRSQLAIPVKLTVRSMTTRRCLPVVSIHRSGPTVVSTQSP